MVSSEKTKSAQTKAVRKELIIANSSLEMRRVVEIAVTPVMGVAYLMNPRILYSVANVTIAMIGGKSYAKCKLIQKFI